MGFEPTPTFVDQNTQSTCSQASLALESGALDHSAILTLRLPWRRCPSSLLAPSLLYHLDDTVFFLARRHLAAGRYPWVLGFVSPDFLPPLGVDFRRAGASLRWGLLALWPPCTVSIGMHLVLYVTLFFPALYLAPKFSRHTTNVGR